MEDRFPVWDEIHRDLISGNVLLARARTARCWAPHTSEWPNTCSLWQTVSLKTHQGAGRHFLWTTFFMVEKKEPLNSSVSSLSKWNHCAIASWLSLFSFPFRLCIFFIWPSTCVDHVFSLYLFSRAWPLKCFMSFYLGSHASGKDRVIILQTAFLLLQRHNKSIKT